jgi:hypothetical protein
MTQTAAQTQTPDTSTPTNETAAPNAETLKAPKPVLSPDAPATVMAQQPAILEPVQPSSVREEQGDIGPGANDISLPDDQSKTFEQCVEKLLVMKGALARSLGTYLIGVFALADEMATTKPVYERETKTGHGKRNPGKHPSFVRVMGERLDYEETTIRHYLKVAELSQTDRQALLDSGAKVDFSFLYQLALEPNPQKRATAIETLKAKGKNKAKADLKAGRPAASKSKKSGTNKTPVDTKAEADDNGQVAEATASSSSSAPPGQSAPSTRKSSSKRGPAPDRLKGGVTVALKNSGDVVVVYDRDQVIRLRIVKVTPDGVHVKLTR